MGITRRSDGTILHANTLLSDLLQSDQVIGRQSTEFYVRPADRETLLGLVVKDGLVRDHELRLKTADGSERWVVLSMQSTAFDGVPALITGFYDVTARREAEEALRASEERYRTILDSVSEIIYMVSVSGDPLAGLFRFGNAGTKDVLGYDPDDFESDPLLWLRIMHPDDRPNVIESTRHMFATGESVAREYRLRHKDTGEYVWLDDKIVAQVDRAGNTIAFLGVARDITSRKRAEKRVRRIAQAIERKVEDRMPKEKRYGLTFREMAVLQLVASGQSDREIATLLTISPRTAHVHVANILSKMGARSRTEAAVKAVKEGLAT